MILATVDGGLKNPPFSLFMTPENTSVSSRAPNGGQRQTHGHLLSIQQDWALGTGDWGLGTGDLRNISRLECNFSAVV